MEEEYRYSIIGEFINSINPNLDQLTVEINEGVSDTLSYINRVGDNIDIIFSSELSIEEKELLDTVVRNHVDSNINIIDSSIVISSASSVRTTNYIRVGTYIYAGSNTVGEILKITALSYMDTGITNYSIRVVDSTNKKNLAENTFTNTSEEIVVLTPINNIPTTESVLEVHVKKTGETGNLRVFIESINVYI